jgi:hypothetical protein
MCFGGLALGGRLEGNAKGAFMLQEENCPSGRALVNYNCEKPTDVYSGCEAYNDGKCSSTGGFCLKD